MKALDYGKGYKYAHDEAEGVGGHGVPAAGPRGAALLPPTDRGFEAEMRRRLEALRKNRR